ncbi:siderophore-interacting protein [Leucobacter chinensis]|uniref:siderophore-interacting protein n=1 Tax=Leucobacter chinensis TaxID=2851010 RepID=UPI001C243212|nr:siderophore-interacting protein [Leucobacter chinensis]
MTTLRHRIRELSQASRSPVIATATITSLTEATPGYTCVTLESEALADYAPTLPADAVKIAVPGAGEAPELRAMTVARRPSPTSIEIEVLRHDGGIVGPWIAAAKPGDTVEVYAVRREHALGDGVTRHLIVADSSALPAAASIVAAIPRDHRISLIAETPAAERSRELLPAHPGLRVTLLRGNEWNEERVAGLVRAEPIEPGDPLQSWIAAEAEIVARLRRQLREAGHPRDHLFAAAYWKAGRDSTARDRLIGEAFAEAAARQADLADPSVRGEVESAADARKVAP